VLHVELRDAIQHAYDDDTGCDDDVAVLRDGAVAPRLVKQQQGLRK
tara:strand:+ start:919 stop:1056 length:138 start_codon:yes stop_codon:yes gene_type:complete